MIRFLIGLIASLFLFSVVRTVIGAMKKEFLDQQSSTTPRQKQQTKTIGGELRKCPSCGTYHAVANIAGRTKSGELVHFCSTECRDKG